MAKTELIFLGTEACIPSPGNDTASYLLNGRILIDTGWHVTETLRRAGYAPSDVQALLFTHMHHDHMMALTAFLYERYCNNSAGKLEIFGPHTMPEAVANARRYIGKEIYWPDADEPQLRVLHGGEEAHICGCSVKTLESVHAVPGLCYRIDHGETGVALGFPGDGVALQEFAGFFRDCDVLTHEYSHGAAKNPENSTKHSSIWDAARTAEAARVGLLCPVHGKNQKECEEILKQHYAGAVHWPKPNDRFVFSAKEK